MKNFVYQFSSRNLIKKITVDCRILLTIKDLKSKIGTENHIKPSKLIIKDYQNDVKTKYIPDGSKFYISIDKPPNSLEFRMPDDRYILISNYNQKTFSDIIQKFEQNGYFFSQLCTDFNLHIFINGHEISRDNNLIKLVHPDSNAEVVLNNKSVKIKYANKELFFKEFESVFFSYIQIS